MAKGCTICQHPNCTEIDSLLDSGEFKKDVALRFGVSVHALSRHGRGLCRANDLDTEEEKWAARLEKTYQQASTDGDARAAQQVASTALRHVRARKAERKAVAKAASDADSSADDFKIPISSFDDVMELFNQVPSTPTDAAKLEEALRRCRELNHLDGIQIFFKMLEDSAFCADLVDYATRWTPKEKGNHEPEPIQETSSVPN